MWAGSSDHSVDIPELISFKQFLMYLLLQKYDMAKQNITKPNNL